MAKVQQALSEHLQRVWQRGWAVVVSGIGGVLGLISLTVSPTSGGKHPHAEPLVATWLWVSLLVGGIMIAQFLAFYDVRNEREEARAEMRLRLDALRFGLQLRPLGTDLAVDPDGTRGLLIWPTLLNGSPEAMEYEVEAFSIVIDGHTATGEPGGRGLILSGREGQFQYPFIPYLLEDGSLAEGTCEYSIAYRHPSGRKPSFRIRQRFGLEVSREGMQVTTRMAAMEPIQHEVIEQ